MSRLALGTVQFGVDYGVANQSGCVSVDEAGRILAEARVGRIDLLDTAVAYGESEVRLGELGTEGFDIVSKVPAVPEQEPSVDSWVDAQVRQSLARLRRSSLWGVLLHRPAQLLGPRGAELYAALTRLRDAGTVGRIGVSIYRASELDELSRFRFDVVQAPFSVFDTGLRDSGWLERLALGGVEVHVRSIFLQGLLLMPAAARPAKFARWRGLWSRWDAWLANRGESALDACVRHALAHPEIGRVVVGVDSVAQLGQIVAAAANASAEPVPYFGATDPDLIDPSRWASL